MVHPIPIHGNTQIRPFADDFCAHILGIDAAAIVGGIADIGMARRGPDYRDDYIRQ